MKNRPQKGADEMENRERIISLVLKAVAVGMSIASIVMLFLPDVSDVNTHITLLSIGLAALALAALQKE
jgi:putative Mn2+ efflux pump MntP